MQGGVQANGGLIGGSSVIQDSTEEIKGSPKAILSRRAQSYADFHYAVKAVLDPSSISTGKGKHEKADIKDDLDFSEWYDTLEHDLLEASHSDYK